MNWVLMNLWLRMLAAAPQGFDPEAVEAYLEHDFSTPPSAYMPCRIMEEVCEALVIRWAIWKGSTL